MTELVIEEKNFNKKHLSKIWQKILTELPEHLRNEAKLKGYKLKLYEEDPIAKYYEVNIPQGTKKLQSTIKRISPYIICLRS